MITIIIPYRDRQTHLEIFLKQTWPEIKTIIPESRLVIVEQTNNHEFNRGLLLNIGFKEYMDDSDCFITHDVDILPCQHIIDNYYKNDDCDIVRILNGHNKSLGGICKFKKEVMQRINGFPNYIWGWGIEDRALYYRAVHKKIHMSKPNLSKNNFKCLKHKSNAVRYIGEKKIISDYIDKISNRTSEMDDEIRSSGIHNIKYSIKEVVNIQKDVYILKTCFSKEDHKFNM